MVRRAHPEHNLPSTYPSAALTVIAPKDNQKPPHKPNNTPHSVLAKLLGTGNTTSKANSPKSTHPITCRAVPAEGSAIRRNHASIGPPKKRNGTRISAPTPSNNQIVFGTRLNTAQICFMVSKS